MRLLRTLMLIAFTTRSISGQRYDDGYGYGNDQGYYEDSMGDYFDKSAAPAGGTNMMHLAATSAVGWFIGGKIHSKRAAAKLKKKHSSERAAFVQLYREQVGALQEFNKESARIIHAMESSIIARQQGVPAEIDTVPFFMADTLSSINSDCPANLEIL